LDEFLDKRIFEQNFGSEIMADERDVEGFKAFSKRYLDAIDVERLSVERFAE
jgi:carbohydrate kinase FGGY